MDTSEAFCPLCQRLNHCAVSAGNVAATCWCMQQPVLEPARLASALPPGTPLHCLCPGCHARLEQQIRSGQ